MGIIDFWLKNGYMRQKDNELSMTKKGQHVYGDPHHQWGNPDVKNPLTLEQAADIVSKWTENQPKQKLKSRS